MYVNPVALIGDLVLIGLLLAACSLMWLRLKSIEVGNENDESDYGTW
jgi:hypothetical protein